MVQHFLDNIEPNKALNLEAAKSAVDFLIQQVQTLSYTGGAKGGTLVGLDDLIKRLVMAMIMGEHCLLEGNPGTAKTLVCKTLARMAGLCFSRVQFVPDMMPSDLIGKDELRVSGEKTEINWKWGPLFANILLADEINRAPSKVQSALLEATEERQVTPIGCKRTVIRPQEILYNGREEPLTEAQILEKFGPFFDYERINPELKKDIVFVANATMNPIEQEGVYPLAQAQIDRFCFKVQVDYPTSDELEKITPHAFNSVEDEIEHDPEQHAKTIYFFCKLRECLLGEKAYNNWIRKDNSYLREKVRTLVLFTHLTAPKRNGQFMNDPSRLEMSIKCEIERMKEKSSYKVLDLLDTVLNGNGYPEVETGSSARGLLKIIRAAHVNAFLEGRIEHDHVRPSWKDVEDVASDILCHRIRLSHASMIEGAKPKTVVDQLLQWIGSWA